MKTHPSISPGSLPENALEILKKYKRELMSFKDYQFHPQIYAGIASCGYTTPTPIQKEAG